MDTADKLRDANPWRAEPDPVKLAILGKLSEELGELQAAVARCIIQGLDGVHPVTGKPNIDWLCEEKTDVENMLFFLGEELSLFLAIDGSDDAAMTERRKKKQAHIQQWLDSLAPEFQPFDKNSKEAFVVAELLGSGWAAVHYWWNDEDRLGGLAKSGFWEPWQVADGRFATVEEADAAARDYARSEGIRYRPQEPKETA